MGLIDSSVILMEEAQPSPSTRAETFRHSYCVGSQRTSVLPSISFSYIDKDFRASASALLERDWDRMVTFYDYPEAHLATPAHYKRSGCPWDKGTEKTAGELRWPACGDLL